MNINEVGPAFIGWRRIWAYYRPAAAASAPPAAGAHHEQPRRLVDNKRVSSSMIPLKPDAVDRGGSGTLSTDLTERVCEKLNAASNLVFAFVKMQTAFYVDFLILCWKGPKHFRGVLRQQYSISASVKKFSAAADPQSGCIAWADDIRAKGLIWQFPAIIDSEEQHQIAHNVYTKIFRGCCCRQNCRLARWEVLYCRAERNEKGFPRTMVS